MTCHWSTSPAAKKHRLQLKWSHYIGAFALHTGKGEQTGNLYAVYVDDAGKVEWITKSSYDASLKAVVFEPVISAFTAWATRTLPLPLPTFITIGLRTISSLQPAGDCSPAPATPPLARTPA